MDSMDLLTKHFKGRKGQWLLVGNNDEKVMLKDLGIGINNSSLTLYFGYLYSNVKIEVSKVFKDNDYYNGAVYMRVYMPEGFHELKTVEFDTAKKLELFLTEKLYEWFKDVERVQGTGLVWED
ncbi:hypothetical protein [Staphylococcus phage vB_SsapH-Golestan101-M]|nr:hypothetical protein [Staphylococcus phage vB_SsapH-Golestan101-M]